MRNLLRWFWVLLLALAVVGVARLRFNIQVLDILPQDLEVVQGLKLYQEHFSDARELIMTLEGAEAETVESSARGLVERLRRMTNMVASANWTSPWQERPGEAAEFLAFLWLNQSPEVFAQLTNRFSKEAMGAAFTDVREQLTTSLSPEAIARLSYDPLGLTQLPENVVGSAQPSFSPKQDLFSSPDGKFRIVFVEAQGGLGTYRQALRWLAEIRRTVEAARGEGLVAPDLKVSFTGAPAFVAEISSGMESDLKKSAGSTLVIIVVLFWWAHRRMAPLLWLLVLLGVVLGGTLALGGVFFGTLSVVSVGFAAILLGLAVDYGLVLYQEAVHAPEMSAQALRRTLRGSILWSALTTAGAFLILNFGGLPGLAQLGSLVAIGVLLAAYVMLNYFLQPFVRGPRLGEVAQGSRVRFTNRAAWICTATAALAATLVLFRSHPRLDQTADSLRPRHSSAYESMERIKQRIARTEDPVWMIVAGKDELDLLARLTRAEGVLRRAVERREIGGFQAPDALVAHPKNQAANWKTVTQIVQQKVAMYEAARAAGFSSNSLALTESIMTTWQRAVESGGVFWPQNSASRWIMKKALIREPDALYALSLIEPGGGGKPGSWRKELAAPETWVASWEFLGADLLKVVAGHFWSVLGPMVVLLLGSLWLAFRRTSEVLLSLFTLAFSGLGLWAMMALMGWSWNLLNLLAVPLLLGSGVDYSIHMQLALRRHGGDIGLTRATIGRAVFLCAATTVAGFGSNAWSSNGGLVSLGKVCAAGIACSYLTSAFLLPAWWSWLAWGKGGSERAEKAARGPSSLYRAHTWRFGLWMARWLPEWVFIAIARLGARVYWHCARHRREIVVSNLMPAVNDVNEEANRKAKRLFDNFAVKMVDLWRYEAGAPVQHLFRDATGWEHFTTAAKEKRGILLLTPHLGNWELGGPWLTQKGVALQVITLAEPDDEFTQMRMASRAKWKIETLVIGNDPFAFVSVIRRLEEGAVVALLVDRPKAGSEAEVELFGRKFPASIAAAELARASGCILLPVFLPRTREGYEAHVLPPIAYNRAELRERKQREALTEQIMRAFEPAIRQYLEQWYHFVPVWPENGRVTYQDSQRGALR
jgi:predicted RND superfamily exporter protein